MQQEEDGAIGVSKCVSDIKRQYLDDFDPKQYHDTYYSDIDDEDKFFIKNYVETFQKNSLLINRTQDRRRVLDFGCGPTPVYAGTAAYFTSSITMAEMLPQNRAALETWMNLDEDEIDALDWSIFFDYIASLGDGMKNGDDIAKMLRSVYQVVFPCDGSHWNPIAPVCQKYDVVMSTFCLEFASNEINDYKIILTNVTRLVRPGGILMMGGALGNTTYSVGDCKFPSVNLTKEILEEVIASLKTFQLVSLETLGRQVSRVDKPTDHGDVFFLVAKKTAQA